MERVPECAKPCHPHVWAALSSVGALSRGSFQRSAPDLAGLRPDAPTSGKGACRASSRKRHTVRRSPAFPTAGNRSGTEAGDSSQRILRRDQLTRVDCLCVGRFPGAGLLGSQCSPPRTAAVPPGRVSGSTSSHRHRGSRVSARCLPETSDGDAGAPLHAPDRRNAPRAVTLDHHHSVAVALGHNGITPLTSTDRPSDSQPRAPAGPVPLRRLLPLRRTVRAEGSSSGV